MVILLPERVTEVVGIQTEAWSGLCIVAVEASVHVDDFEEDAQFSFRCFEGALPGAVDIGWRCRLGSGSGGLRLGALEVEFERLALRPSAGDLRCIFIDGALIGAVHGVDGQAQLGAGEGGRIDWNGIDALVDAVERGCQAAVL